MLVVVVALALLAVRFVKPSFLQGVDDFPEREKVRVASTEAKRDFMFQINGYRTENQGGQKLNMYFHYRYDAGIATGDIPNYEELCTELASDYPIQAISCRLQVYPDYRRGLPYEPGFLTIMHTIGTIEPLAITGPIEPQDD